MVEHYIVGVDCGTTNVKAVLFDENGRELLNSLQANKVISSEGRMEQDMKELWENVKLCLCDLIKKCGEKSKQIVGLGISGQGEGLWAIDEKGNPVRNAILWNDSRTSQMTEGLKKDPQYPEYRKILGTYFKNGSSLVLMKWFLENEPDSYAKTKYFFTCKDYIRYCLTGELFWELSDASASCVDMHTRKYAYQVFDSLGLEHLAEKLPPLISASECAGKVTKENSDAIGLPEDLPVSGGMLDVLSSSAGLGAVVPGDTCVILGTTGMTTCVMKEYKQDNTLSGWGLTLDSTCYGRGIGCMAATPNLDWLLDKLYGDEDRRKIFALMENELSGRTPGSSGLIYHPHISISGERAPFFRSDATAAFLGIRQNTTKMDMIHAVLEGVALAIRDCMKEGGLPKRVFLSGGGAKSKVWAQIISDVLGAEVVITKSLETAAKGAALSAALMVGMIKDMDDVRDKFLTIKSIYKPNSEHFRQYSGIYDIYKETQRGMSAFWEWRDRKMKRGES